MLLVVDASALVAELLRVRGRNRVSDPALQLLIAEDTWDEVVHELGKRVEQIGRRLRLPASEAEDLLRDALSTLEDSVSVEPQFVVEASEDDARWRIERDPNDWPTVALALAVNGGIWTEDSDFLGCGLPTWTIRTVEHYLERRDQNLL